MRKRDRVGEVVAVLGGLLAGEARRPGPAGRERQRAAALRDALERLGPLYIKVGQVLSTRPDIVSPAVMEALGDLHEQVMVRPFSEMEPTLVANLGPCWRDRFRAVATDVPLGAASIAQVYAAETNAGRPVVIKVQRPGVAAAVKVDMEILAQAVRLVMRRSPVLAEIFQPDAMLEVVFSSMRPEVDFEAEARNIELFQGLLARYGTLRAPEVLEATKEVLLLSRAPGTSIRDCDPADFSRSERAAIGRDIAHMLFGGFLVDGVFHADPHPGNIFVAPGEPATLIDFGMIGKIDRRTSLTYTRFMIALSMKDGEAAAHAALELSTLTTRSDVPGFISDMQRWVPAVADLSLNDLSFGNTFTQFLVFCTKRGIAPNPGIALFGKATANMEGSLRRIAPELNTSDVFADVMSSIVRDQARQLQSGAETLRIANETFLAARSIPEQARYLANAVMNGQFVLRTRDDALLLRETHEDARAKSARRMVLAIAGAFLWQNHRHHRARVSS